MIPEQYWRLLSRWGWLIVLFAAAGAAAGFVAGPRVLVTESRFDSSVTLGVSHVVSYAGNVTIPSATGEGQVLGAYTLSIAAHAETPQFLARLQERLAAQGVIVDAIELRRNIDVLADPSISQIGVHATADTEARATLLAEEAVAVLKERPKSEQDLTVAGLTVAMTDREASALSRLEVVNTNRQALLAELDSALLQQALDDLIESGAVGTDVVQDSTVFIDKVVELAGQPRLTLLNAQAQALGGELARLAGERERLAIQLIGRDEPAFILHSVDTVGEVPTRALRKRDMGLVGAVAGLVLGWFAANLANNATNARGGLVARSVPRAGGGLVARSVPSEGGDLVARSVPGAGGDPVARSVPDAGGDPVARSVPDAGGDPVARSVPGPGGDLLPRFVRRRTEVPKMATELKA